MASQIRYDTEALVIGAGPTRLFMAAELLRRGVACRVIDKAPAPAAHPNRSYPADEASLRDYLNRLFC